MAKPSINPNRDTIRDDPALRADGARTDIARGEEPHREEFLIHVDDAERRAPQVLNLPGDDPGQQDPQTMDTLNEANDMVLPTDDEQEEQDVPVMDLADDDPAFPLVDRAPIDGPDVAIGDVDDEDRAEAEQDAEDEIAENPFSPRNGP